MTAKNCRLLLTIMIISAIAVILCGAALVAGLLTAVQNLPGRGL